MECGKWLGALGRKLGKVWGRGQSEILGVIILLGIIVILATVLGVFLFGNFGGGDEQLLANVQGNVTLDGITLDHQGGDKFEPENVQVLLQGDTGVSLTVDGDFNTTDGAGTFAPGDTWRHTTNDSFYGGDFRLLVIHEPTNTVLLDQPHSLPITDVSLLAENWRGEMRTDRATVFGSGSEYNFTVEVNARDGESPQTVPLSAASTGLDVNVSVLNDTHGMVNMTDTTGQSGTFTANWTDGVSTSREDVVLQAKLDEDRFDGGVMLDTSDTTTVRVLRNKSVFTVDFASGYPLVNNEGNVITSYNVTNVGVTPGNVTVGITYENDTTGTELTGLCEDTTGTIDPGTSTIRSDEDCHFQNDGEFGDINVTVSVPTDQTSAVVTPKPPEFLVNITDAPSAVRTGEKISVDANITNVGGVLDDQSIELDATDGAGYSDSNTTPSGNLTPGDSVLVENLQVTAPSSSTDLTLNLSSDQNYSTAVVEVQSALIPIQTRSEWDALNAFSITTASTGGPVSPSDDRTGPVGTDEINADNNLNASGESIAVVANRAGTLSAEDVDKRLRDIIDTRTNAGSVDLIRPDGLMSNVSEYTTFVIYRFSDTQPGIISPDPGPELAGNFTGALNDTQSVVYLATNTGFDNVDYADAIRSVSINRSDPTGYSEGDSGIDGTPMEITAGHPIWTGIGNESNGYEFDTHNLSAGDTGSNYFASFTGYSGTILGADVHSGDPGVTVNDNPDNGGTEVLLTNAMPYHPLVTASGISGDDALTGDAKTLLANAVKYAAAGGGGDPNFTVQAVSPNAPVQAGNDLDIDVTVENTGATSGTQTVRLEIKTNPSGFTQVDSTTLSLNSGQTGTPTLTYGTNGGDTPSVDVKAITDNSSLTSTGVPVSSPSGPPSGNTDITYGLSTSRNNVALPPGADPGSGEFTFTTGSSSGSGAVVWKDYLDGENWVRFEYSSTDLNDGIETNVSIDGNTKWASAANTGGGWETRLVDIAAAGDNTPVGFGLEIPASTSPSTCSSPCSLYYDNVTFVNHSLPLQTADDWVQTGGTLDGAPGMAFDTDTSESTTSGVSGQFDGSGTASVAVRERLTGGDWLTFDYRSSSFGSLTVITDGTDELTVSTATSGWESESVFLDDTGNTKIEFELSCPSTCQFNLDSVRLEPPGPSIPVKTQRDWSEMSATFESTDATEMGFEVNTTVSNVSGASGRFTASTFANGVARVNVTENLTSEDAFSFDYRGADLGIAQVSAAVTVDGDTVWTSSGDPGGWRRVRIDVSDYSTTTEVAFEMRVSTETLNKETIFFDNVTWDDLPGCSLDQPSYDSGTGDFELIDGSLSTCALKADSDPSSDSLLSSSGLDDPQWFDPPESDYPARGGRISYSVKAEAGTTAELHFGDDASSDRYTVRWNPASEVLAISGDGTQNTTSPGANGAGDYYRLIVDWDFDSRQETGVIHARAVNNSGSTVARTWINDVSYNGAVGGTGGGIGFTASGSGTAVWDNLDYGGTNFEAVLPEPGESYYANGTEVTVSGPPGVTHYGGWIHDRLPVEEGETRTYNYYVDVGTELFVALRNGTATETQSLSDIENAIHAFNERLNFDSFRAGEAVMATLTIDYTDKNEIEMRAKATVADGYTVEVSETWAGASSHGEVYVSTYEYNQPFDQRDSLRLLTERTGPDVAAGFPYDTAVHDGDYGHVSTAVSGYGHSGGWVDQNGPTDPGAIERIPFFGSFGGPSTSDLRIQVRDEPASDQTRLRGAGPHQEFLVNIDDVLEVSELNYTMLILDYSVPGEVLVRATSMDGNPAEVVGTALISLPDSAPDDTPVYLSTHEDGNPDAEDSVRYSPFG